MILYKTYSCTSISNFTSRRIFHIQSQSFNRFNRFHNINFLQKQYYTILLLCFLLCLQGTNIQQQGYTIKLTLIVFSSFSPSNNLAARSVNFSTKRFLSNLEAYLIPKLMNDGFESISIISCALKSKFVLHAS